MALKLKPILPLEHRPESGKAVLHALAKARGCNSAEEIRDFYSPRPSLEHPVGKMRDFAPAATRIREAIAQRECVVVFGDYDVDGVTSTAQLRRFLANRGVEAHPYIPDRLTEDYGLTLPSAKTCLERFAPTLLITVDCGSLCHSAIEFLSREGVDVIVLDHHELDANAGPNPALAHINPSEGEFAQIQRICASALVYFFCDALTNLWGEPWPERERQLILAGIGTTCDVMPLVGLNRSLVKHSLALINSERGTQLVPGIVALVEEPKRQQITATTYGFTIGPCLNSAGRIDHASRALEVVDGEEEQSLRVLAAELVQLNNERKTMQRSIEAEATAMAEDIIQRAPQTRILLLGKADWHPGVIGIVASRIKDLFDRPVIICGKSDGFWKGSGRSVEGCHLGELVHNAVHEGVIEGGGGHAAAAGVRLQENSFDSFFAWLQDNSHFNPATYRKEYEVIGRLEWTDPQLWLGLFERMRPFGMGNPTPRLLAENGLLQDYSTKVVRATGLPWAIEGTFALEGGKRFKFLWPNPRKAGALWQQSQAFDSVLTITRSEWRGRTFTNFSVEASAESEAIAAEAAV